jgi:hypothetical protein
MYGLFEASLQVPISPQIDGNSSNQEQKPEADLVAKMKRLNNGIKGVQYCNDNKLDECMFIFAETVLILCLDFQVPDDDLRWYGQKHYSSVLD